MIYIHVGTWHEKEHHFRQLFSQVPLLMISFVFLFSLEEKTKIKI